MNNFFKTVKKIYFSHNIVLWLILLVLPVSISFFMQELFSAQIITQVPLGIVSYDNSKLAADLTQSLKASPVINVKAFCSDIPSCERKLLRSEIQAFVVFPSEMERRALRLETPVIPVYSNGQFYLANSILNKELRAVFTTVGVQIFTKTIKEPIKTELIALGNPTYNYQGFLSLGLVAALFHLSAILIATYVFSFPFRDNLVADYLKIAGSRTTLWCASMIPIWVISTFAFVFTYIAARRSLSAMTFEEFVMIFVASFALVVSCSGFGAALVGITGNMRFSTSVCGVIGGPAFAFAGQTFPILGMPLVVRGFAFLLPLTHFLKIESTLLLGNFGLEFAFQEILILLVMGIFWHLLALSSLFIRWRRAYV